MQRHRTATIAAALTIALIGVGPAGAGPKPSAAASTGSVVGTVRLAGPAPPTSELPVSADHDICGNHLSDPGAAIGPQGEIAWAFAYLEGVPVGPGDHRATVEVNNRGCLYEPYVQGAVAGSDIELVNSDEALHNVHFHLGVRTLWNLALPIPGFRVTKQLPDRPGVIAISCDVHEWMKATIHVLDHPYFATSDEQGRFAIDGVPAGRYTLVVWHERLGEIRQSVQVSDGATSVEVTLGAS